MRTRSPLSLLSFVLLLSACGGDSGTPPPEADPVATVAVSPLLDTIPVGDDVTLQANARTSTGGTVSGLTFVWSSSSSSVASVDAAGRVTGVAPGTAEIRALTEGVTGVATIVVEPRPVASITIAPTVDSIAVGEQIALAATPFDDQGAESDAAVVWTSDDPSVATIEAASAAPGSLGTMALVTSAVVTGVGPGATTLRASAGTVEEAIAIVVEPEPVASVEVTLPTGLRPGVGGAASALARTATGAEVNGCQVTWSVADDDVAEIDASGTISARGAGATDIEATADCGPSGQSSGVAELVVDASRVVAVGTGRWFGCALVEDASQATRDLGSVYCWGANHHGQLGGGGFADQSTPQRVAFAGMFGGSSAASDPARRAHEVLVLGDEHACALDETGGAWCWGDNLNGQLGDGTTTDRSAPVQVSGVPPLQALTAGEEFTCGLDFQGAAWCWGEGTDGQLGNGGFVNRRVPVQVSGGLEWEMIRAGEDAVCGLDSAGAAWCWGENDRGGLGDGTLVNRAVPTAVVGPLGSSMPLVFDWLGTASDMACGLESGTGESWCWGRNDEGQLGFGLAGGQRNRPVQVSGPSDPFRLLSTSGDDDGLTVCGIQDGGDGVSGPAFCWGGNATGQLGDGTATDRTVPTALSTTESFVYITSASQHSCGITSTWALMCWGGDSRGQLGNGPPLMLERVPGIVVFPATAPFAANPG